MEDNDEESRYYDDLMVLYMKILRAIAVVTARLPDDVVDLLRNNILYIS